MTLQEKFAAAPIGATVTASAAGGAAGLDDFEAQMNWLYKQQAEGRVLIIDARRESHTGHRRLFRVLFKRLS